MHKCKHDNQIYLDHKFGESKYHYAYTIPSLKPYLREPINALSSLSILLFAWVKLQRSTSEQFSFICYLYILNGISAFVMHAFLPAPKLNLINIIAAMDYGSLIAIVFFILFRSYIFVLVIMFFYIFYETRFTLQNRKIIDNGLEGLFAMSSFVIMFQHTHYINLWHASLMFLAIFFQLIDRLSLVDDIYVIILLRNKIPTHACWHIFASFPTLEIIERFLYMK